MVRIQARTCLLRMACLIAAFWSTPRDIWANETPSASNRYALLAGCTRYPSLQSGLQLIGPGNDVELFRELLVNRFRFPTEHVHVLAEHVGDAAYRPTRRNILREFQWLADTAQAGDQVVVFLAGHGSQQPDDDPDNPDDPEYDGKDEVFCPADVTRLEANADDRTATTIPNSIPDDELRDWLQKIQNKGAFVWAIFDACHSGTMTRGNDQEVRRYIPPEELLPAAALEAATQARGVDRDPALELPKGAAGLIALYATQPGELTYEKALPSNSPDAKRFGLLTYAMNQVLRSPMQLTYRELLQGIHSQYVAWGRTYPTPLMEGDQLDREVLGLRDWPGRSQIVLRIDEPHRFTINAGELHGLTAGSVLAVYPSADRPNPEQPLGHVRVTRLGALDASVEPCAYGDAAAPRDLPSGARCELVFVDCQPDPMLVAADPRDEQGAPLGVEQFEVLRRIVEKTTAEDNSPIKAVDDIADAEWLVRQTDGTVSLVPASGVLRRGLQKPPHFGPFAIDDRLPVELRNRLQRIARAHSLLTLAAGGQKNARGVSPVQVAIELLRYDDEHPEGEPVDAAGGRPTLQPGEIVAFRVENLSRMSVDVTLLFVDSNFGITAFFPPSGVAADNRLKPNRFSQSTLITPRARVTPAPDLEHMVVIAVKAEPMKAPTEFGFLAQPSIERARGVAARQRDASINSPLGQLLQRALYQEGDARGLSAAQLDEYATQVLSWRVAPAAP